MKKRLALALLLAFPASAFADEKLPPLTLQTTDAPPAAMTAPAPAPAPEAQPSIAASVPVVAVTTLNCTGDAVTKKYGPGYWLVSACNDGRSLAFVASEGNPARPFTLMRAVQDGTVTFSANGTGDKGAADAALAEIKTLSQQDVDDLIAKSKGAK